jgi:hypothetical protein
MRCLSELLTAVSVWGQFETPAMSAFNNTVVELAKMSGAKTYFILYVLKEGKLIVITVH